VAVKRNDLECLYVLQLSNEEMIFWS